MHIKLRIVLKVALILLGLLLSPSVQAQSLAPMKQNVRAFKDRFVVQVEITNTYETSQVSEMTIYDEDWSAIQPIYISHKSARLGSDRKLIVTAVVPMDDKPYKIYHICHAIHPIRGGVAATYKGEVCGKVYAVKLQG